MPDKKRNRASSGLVLCWHQSGVIYHIHNRAFNDMDGAATTAAADGAFPAS